MQQALNIPIIRKLSFSLDQASKRKFLQFLESILSFYNESLCAQFGFSKTDIVCKISKDHKFNYIAYFTYSVVVGRDNIEENSFKSYNVETSKDQISLIIDYIQLVKLRKIFKDISNAEEYFLTAKKQNDNTIYLEVFIPYGENILEFKEKIDIIALKSHIKVELFDREACFFTSLHGNYNLTSFIQFLENLAQDKDNSNYLKIQFGDDVEDGSKILSFSQSDKSILDFPIKVENPHNFDEIFDEFHVKKDEFYRILQSHKSADSFGIFFDKDKDKIYITFTFYEIENVQDDYICVTYGALDIVKIIDKN